MDRSRRRRTCVAKATAVAWPTPLVERIVGKQVTPTPVVRMPAMPTNHCSQRKRARTRRAPPIHLARRGERIASRVASHSCVHDSINGRRRMEGFHTLVQTLPPRTCLQSAIRKSLSQRPSTPLTERADLHRLTKARHPLRDGRTLYREGIRGQADGLPLPLLQPAGAAQLCNFATLQHRGQATGVCGVRPPAQRRLGPASPASAFAPPEMAIACAGTWVGGRVSSVPRVTTRPYGQWPQGGTGLTGRGSTGAACDRRRHIVGHCVDGLQNRKSCVRVRACIRRVPRTHRLPRQM